MGEYMLILCLYRLGLVDHAALEAVFLLAVIRVILALAVADLLWLYFDQGRRMMWPF